MFYTQSYARDADAYNNTRIYTRHISQLSLSYNIYVIGRNVRATKNECEVENEIHHLEA